MKKPALILVDASGLEITMAKQANADYNYKHPESLVPKQTMLISDGLSRVKTVV